MVSRAIIGALSGRPSIDNRERSVGASASIGDRNQLP